MSNENAASSGEPPEEQAAQLPSAELQAASATFAQLMCSAQEFKGVPEKHQRFLERAADHAHEWMLKDERSQALQELGCFLLSRRKYNDAHKVMVQLCRHQIAVYGEQHVAVARAQTLLGRCYHQSRNFDFAIKSLRDAVVRFQSADQLDLEGFVDALCELSQTYREGANKVDAAKTAVKQGLAVLSGPEAGMELSQARLLDEFGSLLYDTLKYDAAIPVFARAVALKQSVLGVMSLACVNSLVSLGMSYYSKRDFESAEKELMKAALICQLSHCSDRGRKSDILNKLAGTLRVMGRLLEAGMIEDGAKEISSGAAIDIPLYDQYRKNTEAGYAAEKAGLWPEAVLHYRQALCSLESFRHRNTADRVAILIRLHMTAEARNQTVQARSLEVEIEQEITGLLGQQTLPPAAAAVQLSRLFRVQGKNVAADSFLSYAERLYRESHDIPALASVLYQRYEVLLELKQHKEAARLEKVTRRLRKQFGFQPESLQLEATSPPKGLPGPTEPV